MKSNQLDWRVHSALLVVQITFGGFSVFGKYVLGYIHPLAVAGLRVLFAAPFLFLLSLHFDRGLPPRREIPRLAILGLFGVCLNQILFIVGLQHTTAINASILMPSIPVFTIIAASILRIEKIGVKRLAGVALSVIGALVMLDVTDFSFSESNILGNTLVLLNCLSYSFFLVLAKPLLLRLSPIMVIAWTYLLGGALVLVVSASTLVELNFREIPALAWLGVAYIVLLATLMNYALNTWAIHRSSPALVATYTTLQPIVAGVLAIAFLGETAGWKEIIGFILIITGLLRISRDLSEQRK